MRVALAQISTTIADFAGNGRKILDGVERAKAAGARVVLFPEMAIPGYPPRDLLDRPAFAREAARTLAEMAPKISGVTAVIGTVLENPASAGKPLFNAAAVVEDGRVVATYRKCLLPTYDVFDEARHFEPGASADPTTLAGTRAALTICEDIWDDPDHAPQRRYGRDPVGAMIETGARPIFNISASPFHLAKPRLRLAMLGAIAAKHRTPLAYVNLVGGNDELVFDGYSLLLDANGRVIAAGKPFEEDFVVGEIDAEGGDWEPRDDLDDVRAALVVGVRDYARKTRFRTAVLGLSGGIDSAVTAAIAAEAFGSGNVVGVSLPSRFTLEMSRADAKELAANLGIGFRELSIEPPFAEMLRALAPAFEGRPWDVTEENLQSRIRGTMLMAISNKHGHLLLTTGNKSEMAVGYCTLYGDMNGGLAAISDVPKTLVYRLAGRINADHAVIPARTLTRPPTAELKAGQLDQDALPPYDVLDEILQRFVVERMSPEEVARATGFGRAVIDDVVRRVERNEFKRRQAPPGIKVTAKAFGMGRRYPIARAFG